MRDFIWPRCPNNWTTEERDFFRALLQVLQEMGKPIEEKDLSKKLQKKIAMIGETVKPETPDTPDTPDTPEQDYTVLYDNGYIDGIEWTANTLPREGQTTLISTYLSGDNQFTFYKSGENTAQHNAHYITVNPIVVPKDAKTMNVEANFIVSRCNMIFGLLPSNASSSVSTANGGQLTGNLAVSTNTSSTYSLTLDDAVKGRKDLYAIINGYVAGGKRLRITKVWFE